MGATIRTVRFRNREWRFVESEQTAWWIKHLEAGRWESDTFDAIDTYVNGGTFVDIGAWVGIFSVYAATRAKQVVALEPDRVAWKMLKKNLRANGVKNVRALDRAAWDYTGKVELRQEGTWGNSMTGPTREGEARSFPCISIRDLAVLADDPVDLVKVDTEGSETHIVPGLLEWGCPLHVSLHKPEMDGPLDFGERAIEYVVGSPDTDYSSVIVT